MESSKREGILKVVTDLKSLKKSGELDEDKYLVYQNLKWRNLLEYSILESCIKHRCPTILRRASDSLIVLQRQLMKEDMILECQKRSCNLHNSCAEPSSIINERIARINVSIESYDTFFSSLKDFCLNSLYPGAVHCRKHSALQILLLMQEFLKHDIISGLWNHSRADRLVQCLFVDTYESNKEVAFKIIKYIQPKVMNLDNKGTVCEIIDTALELANNMRPIDSITASFMLKMACLSPVIDHTLRNYIDPEGKFNSVAESTLLKMMLIIINRLKKPLELAKENIVLACSRHSLYGYIFCVRSLLNILDLRAIQDKDPWRKMITEIVYICFALSGIVSEVVNNSSPEGHLPMDLNIQNNHCLNNVHTSLVTSQMVLLCSWRTIKETSLLFGYLTSKCPLYISESYLGLLSEDQVITIGEHFVTSLCETKHRGAFEQAYVGFEQMCKQLWRSKEEGLQQLPLVWLHYLFLDISGLKNGNFKLCSTRRSAGVPFMVQAIVSSALQKNDNSNNSVFHSVMGILFGFCQLMDSETLFYDIQCIMYNKTIFCQFKSVCDIPYSGYEMTSKDMKHDSNLTEIKTHTLNILRALFKHSLLGDIVKEYISDGFKVAMRSYDGKSWAERNAATLLLGTLITRTFGVLRTKDHINLTVHNKMTGKAFFETHTGLLSLMLDKLYNFIKEDNELINSNIQPILLIASRLYPGNASEDRAEFIWEVEKFIELISKSGTNRVYKTRELAARALVSLSTEDNIYEIFQIVRKNILISHSNPNALHGYILQLHGIVNVLHLTIPMISKKVIYNFLLNTTFSTLGTLENKNRKPACFPAATCCINILSEILEESSNWCHFNEEILVNILNRIQMHLVYSEILKERPGKDVYESEAMMFIISSMINSSYLQRIFIRSLKNEDKNTNFWQSVLAHVNVSVQSMSWKNVFSIIEKTKYRELFNQAIFTVLSTRLDSIENSQVQDALYDFLYACLSYLQKVNGENDASSMDNNDHCPYSYHQDKSEIIHQFCTLIAKMLNAHMQEKYFYETGCFIKLLCKMHGCLSKCYKSNHLMPMCRSDVHKLLMNNSWMCSSDLDCRVEIAKNLSDLYIEPVDLEKSCLILDWWTTLLNLLLDDNFTVRQNASKVICDVQCINNLECQFGIMRIFFEQFLNSVGKKSPAVGLAALITWSITLMEDRELEMDDTDVFNRCSNYECFEPLWIARKCSKIVHTIIKQYSADEMIPKIVRCWLSYRLNVELSNLTTFRELMTNYKNHIPNLKGRLRDILDPTYNSKLGQQASYKHLNKEFTNVL
ncbi:uncharacterized protein LOC117174281 isoform X3 [Belonocnema kinseyi]|uniref:uncharacterized protein LOC117174281 isoform X3 n=1 Tax=Belonocnema kinseyi TaxID=2817044 RepID=UPI00143D06BE|nr:uncharacterized protein LOC117174281 isoform X3 [Belonocnema kinseyi]